MTRSEHLESLGKKYDCDKLGHGYLPFYAEFLPEKITSMLEVGVWHGASARMFDDFFDKRVDIHLVDLFGEQGNMMPREARDLGFIPYKGSQSDLQFLSTIKDQFDFIEEDASHNSYDQIASFKHLFINNLVPGGIYTCEDLHCCTDPFYWESRHEIKSVDDTMLGMIKKYKETGKIINPYFNSGESEVFENLIDRVELVCNDKIVFIWKKR